MDMITVPKLLHQVVAVLVLFMLGRYNLTRPRYRNGVIIAT